jgi:hypothetical protein
MSERSISAQRGRSCRHSARRCRNGFRAPPGSFNNRPQKVRVAGAKPHPTKLVESAAMAAVDPPTPTYKPKLPRAVIEKGLLSEAQLEAVVYAGEAHSEMLPAAEGEQAYRKGYFDGDGTGVGKGRTIAGIILDNWNHGRKKAVWVSEKQALIEYAKDDWSGLEQKPDTIFNFSKVNTGEAVKAQQGIGFITYDTLKGGLSAQQALARGKWVKGQKVQIAAELGGGEGTITGKPQTVKGTDVYSVRLADGSKGEYPVHKLTAVGEAVAVTTRIDQIVEWFGKDFDGVIAFDEAHNMGNADRQKGDYRTKEAALKALAGLELQQRLPNARVLYVSATGATEVSNLAYAERIGLVGPRHCLRVQECFRGGDWQWRRGGHGDRRPRHETTRALYRARPFIRRRTRLRDEALF